MISHLLTNGRVSQTFRCFSPITAKLNEINGTETTRQNSENRRFLFCHESCNHCKAGAGEIQGYVILKFQLKRNVKYMPLPASFMQVFAAVLSFFKNKGRKFQTCYQKKKKKHCYVTLKSFHFCPTGGRNLLRKLW